MWAKSGAKARRKLTKNNVIGTWYIRNPVLLLGMGLALPDSAVSSSPLAAKMPLPVISFILYPEQGFLKISKPANSKTSHGNLKTMNNNKVQNDCTSLQFF
jgi:hypothetical protein